jgi:hypothetical protein
MPSRSTEVSYAPDFSPWPAGCLPSGISGNHFPVGRRHHPDSAEGLCPSGAGQPGHIDARAYLHADGDPTPYGNPHIRANADPIPHHNTHAHANVGPTSYRNPHAHADLFTLCARRVRLRMNVRRTFEHNCQDE